MKLYNNSNIIFYFKIKNVLSFKNIIEILDNIFLNKTNWIFNKIEDNIVLEISDIPKTYMSKLTLDTKTSVKYFCKFEKYELAINLKVLYEILQKNMNYESIIMYVEENNEDFLKIEIDVFHYS